MNKNKEKDGVIEMRKNEFIETYQKIPASVAFELEGSMKNFKPLTSLFRMPTKPSFSCVFSSSAMRIAKGRKEVLDLPYAEIKNVEIVISRSKAMMGGGAMVSAAETYYIANLKIKFNEGSHIYFESFILSDIPKVIVILESYDVSVIDVYHIVEVFDSVTDGKEIHSYFERNLDKLAKMNELNPNKQTWKDLGSRTQ